MSSSLTPISNPAFAANTTWTASKQTYYTIRFLADRGMVDDAYRAYAYFRWVDDWLDREECPRSERLAFTQRQQNLIAGVEGGSQPPGDLTPEESLIVELLQKEPDMNSGLYAYARNMMSVMAFDAERRGRLITQSELDEYTHWLAIAVTEAMHYFIGHNCAAPCDETRYLAVSGAHITHMLRDTLEDIAVGYYNIPQEVVDTGGITPSNVENQVYRAWVQERVSKAREYFKAGREYLTGVQSVRCQIAGYTYMHRFETVLDSIERDGYLLHSRYAERNGTSIETIGWAMWMTLKSRQAWF